MDLYALYAGAPLRTYQVAKLAEVGASAAALGCAPDATWTRFARIGAQSFIKQALPSTHWISVTLGVSLSTARRDLRLVAPALRSFLERTATPL